MTDQIKLQVKFSWYYSALSLWHIFWTELIEILLLWFCTLCSIGAWRDAAYSHFLSEILIHFVPVLLHVDLCASVGLVWDLHMPKEQKWSDPCNLNLHKHNWIFTLPTCWLQVYNVDMPGSHSKPLLPLPGSLKLEEHRTLCVKNSIVFSEVHDYGSFGPWQDISKIIKASDNLGLKFLARKKQHWVTSGLVLMLVYFGSLCSCLTLWHSLFREHRLVGCGLVHANCFTEQLSGLQVWFFTLLWACLPTTPLLNKIGVSFLGYSPFPSRNGV
jgi:hypothetical protein